MRVGITGGNGFIGTHITRLLHELGHTTLVLDHKNGPGNVMLGDVRDRTAVSEFAAHVQGIIHLAAVLGTAETIEDPIPAADINITGTLNVFQAATRYDLPVVYAAVGNSGIGRGTYCITKTCGEEFVHMYREDRGLPVIAVRPVNAYGPGQTAPAPYGPGKVNKIVPSFACAALSGQPMRLFGGGGQVSDSVHVTDVARCFVASLHAAVQGDIPDHPIDVGNRHPHTVRDVAEAVALCVPGATLTDVPMRPGEPQGGPISTQEAVEALARDIVRGRDISPIRASRAARQLGTVVSADTTTLKHIGIDPDTFIPLHDGIASTVDWFRAMEGTTWQSPN